MFAISIYDDSYIYIYKFFIRCDIANHFFDNFIDINQQIYSIYSVYLYV